MADDNIEINVTANTEDAEAALKRTAGQVDSLSGQADKSSAALKGFKFAGKELGHQFGLTGGMSRMFGGELAELGATAGTAGLAIGGLAIVGIGAYKVYQHFTEEAQKNREELDKQIATLRTSTSTLYENKLETEQVRESRERLAKIDREQFLRKSAEKIRDETDAIKEQKSELSGWEKLKSSLFIGGSAAETEARTQQNRARMLADKQYEINKRRENLTLLKEEANAAAAPPWKGYSPADFEAMRDMDLIARAQKTADTLFAITLESNQKRGLSDYERVQNSRKLDLIEQTNKIQIYGATANLLEQVYQLGHEKYKVFFYASRAAAASESIIQGYLGASKAVGTFWGMEMAPLMIGMGYANAAMIMAQTFLGGGKGGGAVGTFSANPTTGLPVGQSSASQTVSLTINVNGQRTGVVQLTGDVLRTIYNNNGSVDGFSVDVGRSA